MEGTKAKFYKKEEDAAIRCYLCPHGCVIKPEKQGVCQVRKNIGGELYSQNYGMITSIALDPIEKKPLYQFYPGSLILSVGTFGCNFKCPFCQNYSIAHEKPKAIALAPEELVEKALELREDGNVGIAYTYNEPSIWYEFVYDASRLAKEKGLVNVLVTNGFIGKEALEELLPLIDAMNIDVKGYKDSFYDDVCNGSLEHVKQTVDIASKECHVEVTTLLIPELNDRMEEIEALASWLASISPHIPLHLTRYFPNYKMTDRPPTPLATLKKAKQKASEYLTYVYLGNV